MGLFLGYNVNSMWKGARKSLLRLSGFKPKFLEDVARWVKFTVNSQYPDYLDEIGVETREPIPDYAIEGNEVATVTFDASIDEVIYIQPDLTETTAAISGAWTIPSLEIAAIKLYSAGEQVGYLPCQESSGLVLLDRSGNDNHAVLSDSSVWKQVIYDVSWNNDSNANGSNKAAYFGGNGNIQLPSVLTYSGDFELEFYLILNTLPTAINSILDHNVNSSCIRFTSTNVTVRIASSDNIYLPNINVGVNRIKFTRLGNQGTLTISGATTYTNTLTVPTSDFLIENIGCRSVLNDLYLQDSSVVGLKGNGEYIAELNGSAPDGSTVTNVDFNTINLPAPDLFGRDDLYSGLVKLNAEVKGGIVGEFNTNSDVAISRVELRNGDVGMISFKPNTIASGVNQHLLGGIKESPSRITRIFLFATIANRITVAAVYADESGGSSNIFDFSTPFSTTSFTDLTISVSGTDITLTRLDTSESITKTYPQEVYLSFDWIGRYNGIQGFGGSICCFAKNNTTLYYLNGHTINSVDGIEATNNGVTFTEITDYTPESSKADKYVKLVSGNFIPNPQPQIIKWEKIDDSAVPRLEPIFPTFNGTIRTLGTGGDYTSFKAAWDASSTGDQIQLISNIEISTDTNGYALLNGGKSVRIFSTNGSKITNTAGTYYNIRIYQCLNVLFEGITFESNGSRTITNELGSYADTGVYFKNCKFTNSKNAASMIYQPTGSVYLSNNYFDNCEFESSSLGWCYYASTLLDGSTHYFKDCVLINTNAGCQEVIQLTDTTNHRVYIYDTYGYQSTSQIIFSFGVDTAAPTKTDIQVDMRDCYAEFTDNSLISHSILFGRGTSSINCINNYAYIPKSSNLAAIGFVLKNRSTGDKSLVKGNYANCLRPFYVKGGNNMDIQYNYGRINTGANEAFYVQNKAEDVDLNCNDIVFKNNYGRGGITAIRFDSDTSESIEITKASWEFDNNVYDSNQYYLISEGNQFLFSERADFWEQDSNSQFKNILIDENPVLIDAKNGIPIIDGIVIDFNQYASNNGFITDSMMNKDCYVGNAFGLPEIWKATIIPFRLTDSSYYWLTTEINETFILAHITDEFKGYLYARIFDGELNIQDVFIYLTKRTDAQQTEILEEDGVIPNYIGLPVAVLFNGTPVTFNGEPSIYTP